MKKLLWTGVVVGMLACSSENKQDKKNIVESTQSDTQQKIEKVFLQKEKVPHKSELIESFPVLRQLESISVEDRKVLEDLLEIKTNFVMARDHRPHLIKAVFEAIQTLSEKHTQEDWLQILNRNGIQSITMSGVGQENNDHNGYGIMYTLPINSVCKDYGKFEKIISGDENIDVYYFMNKGANTYGTPRLGINQDDNTATKGIVINLASLKLNGNMGIEAGSLIAVQDQELFHYLFSKKFSNIDHTVEEALSEIPSLNEIKNYLTDIRIRHLYKSILLINTEKSFRLLSGSDRYALMFSCYIYATRNLINSHPELLPELQKISTEQQTKDFFTKHSHLIPELIKNYKDLLLP